VFLSRSREIGLLRALGFDERKIRAIFIIEGLYLSAVAASLGWPSHGYRSVIMHGLRNLVG